MLRESKFTQGEIMKSLVRAATLLIAFTPAAVMAQSAFDGTWKTDLKTVKVEVKPMILTVREGFFQCKTCLIKAVVKADGSDQRIIGNPYADTISAKVVDKNTVETVTKKNGKEAGWIKRVAAADGKTMTIEYKTMPLAGGEVATGKTVYKRIDKEPPGTHALTGTWQIAKFDSYSDSAVTVSYHSHKDFMNWSSPTGESYSAKMDGSDATMKGDSGVTTIAVKMSAPNVLEETSKFRGEVVGTSKMTVDATGKTATVEWTDKRAESSGSFVMVKQ